MNDRALTIEGLSKAYHQKQVLVDLNLTLDKGEYLGLVGVNGAGKTTLIKCLLDFCSVDSGAIKIFGEPHHRTAARISLAFLPERSIPPHFLRGIDFLHYMASLYQIKLNTHNLEELLFTLDLDRCVLQEPVHRYSKGMVQKLGLIASLISARELLILDEPMSGLDPLARARLKHHLLGLRARGQSLFYCTHLLEDVESLCDRLLILHHGRIRFSGSLTDCLRTFSASTLEEAYLNCTRGSLN